MAATIIREESFDPADYRGELDAASENLDVGTRLWFENDHIRVWEVRLRPGERGPFHAHTRRYFWTVVDGGIGRPRAADGTMITREYHVGDTNYSRPLTRRSDDPRFRERSFGDTPIRFTTVELLD